MNMTSTHDTGIVSTTLMREAINSFQNRKYMTEKQYVFQDGDNITIDSDGSITYVGKHANKARKIINNVLKKCMLPETPKNVIHLIDRIVVPLEQGMVIFG